MLNNMWSYGAVNFALLRSSVVPPPPLPQLGGKLAGEPADVLLLKSKTAGFYKIEKLPEIC